VYKMNPVFSLEFLVSYRFSIFKSYFLHFISPINKNFKLWSKTISR
jgi:hypothetical protein